MALASLRAARLSDAEVGRLLYKTGWRGEDLETAIRIVLGESGGNPGARNVNVNRTVDRGLFQLNDRAFPALAPSDAFDAAKNAAFAFQVYKRQKGFRPHRSAWWGHTHFHTLNPDGSPATDLVARAKAARDAAEGVDSQAAETPRQAGGSWVWLLLIGSLAFVIARRTKSS